MKTPKNNYEFCYKIKVVGRKARLIWSKLPFSKQNPIYTEIISKGYVHIGTYRINPIKHTAGFKKINRNKKKILYVTIIRLPKKRKVEIV